MVREPKYHRKNKFIKKLLEEIMPRYDRQLPANMVLECKRVMRDCDENEARLSERSRILLEFWTIKDARREPAYFTAKFSMPVVQYIPSCFKHLHSMLPYTRHGTAEYIPCYLMNLNHVVLVKIPHEGRRPPSTYRDIGDGLFNMVVYQKGRHMELDSANILLGGRTHDRSVAPSQDIIRRCFEMCYWRLPPAKDAGTPPPSHNLIYHTNQSIHNVIRLQKTILRVIKISKERPRWIEVIKNRSVEYVKADVALLVDDGRSISSEFRKGMMLTADVAQPVREGDVLGVLISEDIKYHRPLVVGRVGDPGKPGDLKPLLGVILWRLLQRIGKDSSMTKGGDINEISNQVSEIIEDNSTDIDLFYPSIAWNHSAQNIKKSIDGLFPLYMLKNDEIHQISPAALSFIISAFPGMLAMRESTSILINLLQIIKTGVKQDAKESAHTLDKTRFQTDGSAQEFLGMFLENLPSIINEMVYSRIFSKDGGC